MIISRTPLRISFFGGGTDYPDYFRSHGGQVLSTSIQKYSYINVRRLDPIFDFNYRISYSSLEVCKNVEEIRHPSVRECLKFLKMQGGIEVHYAGDLPARTGLGSSSSFTVGLLHCLYGLSNIFVSHERLASDAVFVEQELIGERVGVQDQYAAAFGGFNKIVFQKDGTVIVNPLVASRPRLEELKNHLMLFYTGISRTAHEVLEEQVTRTKKGDNNSDLNTLFEMVNEATEILTGSKDIRQFGELLHLAWESKRRLSRSVSNPTIDSLYASARGAGAIGGKLLGAGGGGFLLLFVEPHRQNDIRNALHGYASIDLEFDSDGSRIIYVG